MRLIVCSFGLGNKSFALVMIQASAATNPLEPVPTRLFAKLL